MTGVKKAFTLIEVVVAVAIFSVIVLAAVRIFQSSMRAQRDIEWDYTLQSDSQYFLNLMSRELSTAQKDLAGTCSVPAGHTYATDGSVLYFKNSLGQCVAYGAAVDGGVTKVGVDRDGVGNYLSGSGIDIEQLAFTVDDDGSSTSQPLATVNMKFRSINSASTTAINLQLSISPILAP